MTTEIQRPLIGCAICIRRNGKILLQKRLSKHAHGFWGFPGGHLEWFEEPEKAVLREMQEEAGDELIVTPPVFWTIANTRFYNENKHYVVLFYLSDWIAGEAIVKEPTKCEQWGWFDYENLPSPLMMGIKFLMDNGELKRKICKWTA